MVVLKYTKKDGAEYLSHLDILRVLTRTLRRAGISVERSKGFNPHMNLYMGAPISLGLKSVCEYVCIDTTEQPDILYRAFNSYAQNGVRALGCVAAASNPNIPSLAKYVRYNIMLPKGKNRKMRAYLERGGTMTYERNGKMIEDDFGQKIIQVKPVDDNNIKIIAATGNITLRMDRLMEHLCQELGIDPSMTDVLREELFAEKYNKLISIDDFLGIS